MEDASFEEGEIHDNGEEENQEDAQDIWDDSVLIDAYNNAVKGYKQHHGLAPKDQSGSSSKNKKKKRKRAQKDNSEKLPSPKHIATEKSEKEITIPTPIEKDEHKQSPTPPAAAVEAETPKTHTEHDTSQYHPNYSDFHPSYSSHYHMPHFTHQSADAQPMLPPVLKDDEMLSQLCMAWYYAGYYTSQYLESKNKKQ